MVDLKLNAILTAGSERAIPFLQKVGRSAKENLLNFDAMTKLMNDAFGIITKVGIGAVAAFTGLAFISPTVQAALARMKPTLFKIGETIGKTLEPGLKKFGGILKDVSLWLDENTWFTDGLTKGFSLLADVVGIVWDKMSKLSTLIVKPLIEWAMEIKLGEKIKWLVDTFGYTILGALIGLKFGLPGVLVGGGLGLAADVISGTVNRVPTEEEITTGVTQQWRGGTMGSGQPNIIVNINGVQITPDNVEVLIG